jgi:hypothetical protein
MAPQNTAARFHCVGTVQGAAYLPDVCCCSPVTSITVAVFLITASPKIALLVIERTRELGNGIPAAAFFRKGSAARSTAYVLTSALALGAFRRRTFAIAER